MSAIKLPTIRVEKPWGRRDLWPGFADPAPADAPVGEIWFDAPEGRDPALMVKYLFTSERLSIQVHPDNDAARAAGHARGKDEAWLVLAADPGATIALGLREPVSKEVLRAACLDGGIVQMMDWKPVRAGDFIYSPAGMVHAIGAGITLVEIQQNVDLTYRLYDYGRPRELHLDAGIAVADPVPFVMPPPPVGPVLTQGGAFCVERLEPGSHDLALAGADAWLVPVRGSGAAAGGRVAAGECWLLGGDVRVTVDPGAMMLLAIAGPDPAPRG